MNHPLPPTASATLQLINPGIPVSRALHGNPSFTTWCRDSACVLTFDDVDAARAWFSAGLEACFAEVLPADEFPVQP